MKTNMNCSMYTQIQNILHLIGYSNNDVMYIGSQSD